MLPYYRTAASTMYTLKCMVYITAPKTELQFGFLLGPIPLPFFPWNLWLAYSGKTKLHFSEYVFILCYKDMLNSWNFKVGREFGKFWKVTSIAGILTVHYPQISAQSSAKWMLPLRSVYCEKTKKCSIWWMPHTAPLFFNFAIAKLLPLQQILSAQFINNSQNVFELLTSAKL